MKTFAIIMNFILLLLAVCAVLAFIGDGFDYRPAFYAMLVVVVCGINVIALFEL